MAVIAHLQDRSLIIAEWTFTCFTLSLVLLRVYFRTVQTRWRKADTFVVMAWFLSLVQVVADTEKYRRGVFGEYAQYTLSLKNAIIASKLSYTQSIVYFSCVYAVKASMLSFYCEIVDRYVLPTSFRILQILVGVVICSYLFSLFAFLFWCKDISDNWRVDRFYRQCYGAGYDYRISSPVLALHLLTDLLIYLYPILILKKLHLPRAKKVGAAIMFFLGLISLINATTYFIVCFIVGGKAGLWNPFLAVWEETSTIIVACCPAFKAFLKTNLKPRINNFFRRSREWISTTLSSSREKKPSTDGAVELRDVELGRNPNGSQVRLSRSYNQQPGIRAPDLIIPVDLISSAAKSDPASPKLFSITDSYTSKSGSRSMSMSNPR